MGDTTDTTAEEYARTLTGCPTDDTFLFTVAGQRTEKVRMQEGEMRALQVVDAGSFDDMVALQKEMEMPSVACPANTWLPLLDGEHPALNPDNPAFQSTIDEVMAAYASYYAGEAGLVGNMRAEVDRMEDSVVEAREARPADFKTQTRGEMSIVKNIPRSTFQARHFLCSVMPDKRDLPKAELCPLVLFLGSAGSVDDAVRLLDMMEDASFQHSVKILPTREWTLPQLLHLRQARDNERVIARDPLWVELFKQARDANVRGPDGKSFYDKVKEGEDAARRAAADAKASGDTVEDAGDATAAVASADGGAAHEAAATGGDPE